MKLTTKQLKQMIREQLEEQPQKRVVTRRDLMHAGTLDDAMRDIEPMFETYAENGDPESQTIASELHDIISKLSDMVKKLRGNPSATQIAQKEKRAAARRAKMTQKDVQYYEMGRDRHPMNQPR